MFVCNKFLHSGIHLPIWYKEIHDNVHVHYACVRHIRCLYLLLCVGDNLVPEFLLQGKSRASCNKPTVTKPTLVQITAAETINNQLRAWTIHTDLLREESSILLLLCTCTCMYWVTPMGA